MDYTIPDQIHILFYRTEQTNRLLYHPHGSVLPHVVVARVLMNHTHISLLYQCWGMSFLCRYACLIIFWYFYDPASTIAVKVSGSARGLPPLVCKHKLSYYQLWVCMYIVYGMHIATTEIIHVHVRICCKISSMHARQDSLALILMHAGRIPIILDVTLICNKAQSSWGCIAHDDVLDAWA